MISPDYVRTMALYNRWQNRSLYREADKLSPEQRLEERGAFFGSVHATLNHLLFGDQIWMSRFTGRHAPEAATVADSTTMVRNWDELCERRSAFDDVIIAWSQTVSEDWLTGALTWRSTAIDLTLTKPRWITVVHMFNHQTHHRGQVHALLTGFGLKPDDTDLPLLPS